MALKVLFFGRLRELAGDEERIFHPPPARVELLIAALAMEAPALGEALAAKGVKIAADHVYVDGSASLDGVGELAFMPPLSGG